MPPEQAEEAPISLHDYMAAANAAYYAGRDPLGARGDFITAPEVSQMFGELIGLMLADMARRAGVEKRFAYVELGPGRGTLAADALRAMAAAAMKPAVHFVETSPVLRERQRAAVPGAVWHDAISSLPDDMPLLVVANEFFDALPIRQYVRTALGWREQMLMPDGPRADSFRIVPGRPDRADAIPAQLADAPPGAIVERNPQAEAIVADLSDRIARQGGMMLVLDYGYEGPAVGDTLQAMSVHEFADPFFAPGTRDLTAHVDFAMIAAIARAHDVRATPCIGQGAFLAALGIDARARALARTNPGRAVEIEAARRRLTAPEAMGTLFRALALRHRDWPLPAGFG